MDCSHTRMVEPAGGVFDHRAELTERLQYSPGEEARHVGTSPVPSRWSLRSIQATFRLSAQLQPERRLAPGSRLGYAPAPGAAATLQPGPSLCDQVGSEAPLPAGGSPDPSGGRRPLPG